MTSTLPLASPTAPTQLYGEQVSSDNASRIKKIDDEHAATTSEYKTVGAKHLVHELQKSRTVRILSEVYGIQPLSDDAVTVWKGFASAKCTAEEFTEEHIPVTVVRQWAQWKERSLFDGFEIWSTSRQRAAESANESARLDDPVLVGRVGDDLYLLARWGKEDANFLTFEQVVDWVYTQRLRVLNTSDSVGMKLFKYGLCFLISFVVAMCVYLVITTSFGMVTGLSTSKDFRSMFGVLGAVTSCVFMYRIRTNTRADTFKNDSMLNAATRLKKARAVV
jgi:hypothetical protein